MISGSTDGNLAFWDLTDSIEAFMERVSVHNIEKFFDCQKRPRTGRGSQGGRWWRSLNSKLSKKKQDNETVSSKIKDGLNDIKCTMNETSSTKNDYQCDKKDCSQSLHSSFLESETNNHNSSSKICEIPAIHILKEIHQSGVNCLHVSEIKCDQSIDRCHMYSIISGGDDQALNHLLVELSSISTNSNRQIRSQDIQTMVPEPRCQEDIHYPCQSMKDRIKILCCEKFPSAHSSAVKGN